MACAGLMMNNPVLALINYITRYLLFHKTNHLKFLTLVQLYCCTRVVMLWPHIPVVLTHICLFVVKVFRTYREAFESQKLTIEQRFRGLLEEAIQDAIFLATKNAELIDENRRLNEGMVRYFYQDFFVCKV